jgi:hypothetical protein
LVGFEGKLKAVGDYQGFGESELPLTLLTEIYEDKPPV